MASSEEPTVTYQATYKHTTTFTVQEETVTLPKSSMTTKLYGKDLKEYEELDVETLLAKLTPDELEELNNEVDPDNSLLPPHQRCRDQTDKDPTGPFKREQLLKYLEEKAKTEKDWDEKVPYQAGLKRGRAWEPKESDEPEYDTDEVAIELDIDDDIENALGDANERDLVDLAGILGMHSMLNQSQYYNALKGKPQDEYFTFTGAVKSSAIKIVPDEPPNQTDVDDCIKRLDANDASLTEINLNNMKRVPKERIKAVIEAVKTNKHIKNLSMANTAITDAEARGLVDALEQNSSLTVLNVESNFLSPDLLAKVLEASLKQQSLVEFHAENQRAAVLGNQVEMNMMQSIEENDSLLRVGLTFQSMEARHRVAEALERNYERSQQTATNHLSSLHSHIAEANEYMRWQPAAQHSSVVLALRSAAAPGATSTCSAGKNIRLRRLGQDV